MGPCATQRSTCASERRVRSRCHATNAAGSPLASRATGAGTSRVSRTTYNRNWQSGGTSHAGAEEAVLRPEEIRLLPERHALVGRE